jgi:methylated-DNA-[protein]-cysteine S-methyltransferase
MSKTQKVTEYQERVYALLQQIPEGRITTYAAMSRALNSSPRAIGGALRNNPFAPEIPCHRCIASTGVSSILPSVALYANKCASDDNGRLTSLTQFIGGFKGDWEKVPSGQNQESKRQLLEDEGVLFDANGYLVDKKVLWDDFDVKKLK